MREFRPTMFSNLVNPGGIDPSAKLSAGSPEDQKSDKTATELMDQVRSSTDGAPKSQVHDGMLPFQEEQSAPPPVSEVGEVRAAPAPASAAWTTSFYDFDSVRQCLGEIGVNATLLNSFLEADLPYQAGLAGVLCKRVTVAVLQGVSRDKIAANVSIALRSISKEVNSATSGEMAISLYGEAMETFTNSTCLNNDSLNTLCDEVGLRWSNGALKQIIANAIGQDDILIDLCSKDTTSCIMLEELFVALSTLCETKTGKNLLSEVNRKLKSQFKSPRRLPLMVGIDINVEGDRRRIGFGVTKNDSDPEEYPFISISQQRHFCTYISKQEKNVPSFFGVRHPLAVSLGHELAHALQYCEAPAILAAEAANFPGLCAEMQNSATLAAGFIRCSCLLQDFFLRVKTLFDENIKTKTKPSPCPSFNPSEGVLAFMEKLEAVIGNIPDIQLEKKGKANAIYNACVAILTAWDVPDPSKLSELPNILEEYMARKNHSTICGRETKYSNGKLLGEVMNIRGRNSLCGPKFVAFNPKTKEIGTQLNTGNLDRIWDAKENFVQWGHVTIEAFAKNLSPLFQYDPVVSLYFHNRLILEMLKVVGTTSLFKLPEVKYTHCLPGR